MQASSETLTHLAVYEAMVSVNAVIHVHDARLWQAGLQHLPRTPRDVPYGTPAMADAVQALFAACRWPEAGLFVMAGHQDGLLAFGTTMPAALAALDAEWKM